MKLFFTVPGNPEREAFPLRAIPFVSGINPATSQRNLPVSLVVQSAIQAAAAWPPGIPSLKVYFMDALGKPQQASIDYLVSALPEADFQPEDDEPVAISAMKLPVELFVFADEAQAFIDWLYPAGSFDGECCDRVVINHTPALPAEIIDLIGNQMPAAKKVKPIEDERGVRRLIRECWPKIVQLHGKNADNRQVWRVINKNLDEGQKAYDLHTVQNTLPKLKAEGLLP
jgi:hypothetical protein